MNHMYKPTLETRMLDILEDFMTLRGITFARLDGSTPRPRRSLDIKLVNHTCVSV
jgi:SWI/SNF-related matrix-associated actin-dependent regulator of chromatin subfamily A member 5